MALPAMPAQLVGREYLHVGGGYASAAVGTSPAGGLSADDAGHAAMSGDLTVGGTLKVTGLVHHWHRYVGAVSGAPLPSNPASGPSVTVWGARIVTHTLSYEPTNFNDAHFNVALPSTYDGRTLNFELLWGAQAGTVGGVARWDIRAYCLPHGGNLAETAAPSSAANDTFDGVNLMHVLSITHQPLNAASGGLLSFVVRRRAPDAEDTFDNDAKLIGVRVSYT